MVRLSTRYRNKQLRKRLRGLENKAHEYGKLGVDVVLVLGYPEREGGYSYVTSEAFLERITQVVSTRICAMFRFLPSVQALASYID